MSVPTFVRKATGLVRDFSAFDMFGFNVFAYCLGMVTALGPFTIAILYPGSDFGISLFFATLVSIIDGYVYTQLSIAMPRSGGDYIYTSHTISPAVGFMISGGFVVGIFYWISLTGIWVNQSISLLAISTGLWNGSSALVSWGSTMLAPEMLFVGGTISIALAAIFIIFGTRFLRRFFFAMFIPAMLGSLVLLGVILAGNHTSFVQQFNLQMQQYTQVPDTYSAIITTASDQGFHLSPLSWYAAFLALPYAQWTYLGFQYSVYLGGEVKTPSRSQPIAIIGSLVAGFVVIYLTASGFVNIAGRDFVNSMAYLGGVFPGLPIPNLINAYITSMTDNIVLIWLVGISLFAWTFMVLLTGFMAATRMIFAWAFNRVAPEAFARVSSKYHSPWVATVFMAIGGWVFLSISAFTPFSQFILNYIVIFLVVFFIGGFAALAFPYVKKDLFEASPKIVNRKIAGVPVMVILGIANIFFLGFMIFSSMTNPSYYGISYLVVAFDAFAFIIPLALYYVAKAYRRRQGLNIDLLWKEVPPE